MHLIINILFIFSIFSNAALQITVGPTFFPQLSSVTGNGSTWLNITVVYENKTAIDQMNLTPGSFIFNGIILGCNSTNVKSGFEKTFAAFYIKSLFKPKYFYFDSLDGSLINNGIMKCLSSTNPIAKSTWCNASYDDSLTWPQSINFEENVGHYCRITYKNRCFLTTTMVPTTVSTTTPQITTTTLISTTQPTTTNAPSTTAEQMTTTTTIKTTQLTTKFQYYWRSCCYSKLNKSVGRVDQNNCRVNTQPSELNCPEDTLIWVECNEGEDNCTIILSYNRETNMLAVSKKGMSSQVDMSKPSTYLVMQNKPSKELGEFTGLWASYKNGFGKYPNNFWLGNDNLNSLTKDKNAKLRVEYHSDLDKLWHWGEYSRFIVDTETKLYTLSLGNYTGNGNDAMTNSKVANWNINQMPFSTFDRDNDKLANEKCSKVGWWFNKCSSSTLNGDFSSGWEVVRGNFSLKINSSRMLMIFN